ncbi:MAG TPA: hypothetical protein PKA64_00280 [Myxococcota bacterium]|nr:hypothetical protein [Myxococcota bacterium]
MNRRRGALAALIALTACGKDKATLVLDEATVTSRLEEIGRDVPGCDVSAGAELARVMAGVGALPVPDVSTVSGTCGGTLTVTSEHANGITDYTLVAASLCAGSADGDVVLDGTIQAREIGEPSDVGPVISAFELDSEGPIAIAQGGGTIDLEIDGIRAEYGKPAAWYPEEPDAANPDVTTVDEVRITFSSDGRTEVLRGLRVERTGGSGASLTITDGQLGREGEGFANLRTPPGEPLLIDTFGLSLSGGAIELDGAKDTVLRVTPGGSGTLVFELDGAPFPTGLDCSVGRQPMVEVGMALLVSLPIY